MIKTYRQATEHLRQLGFIRVERDDRMLDIFPDQTREKGIELWERWSKDTVLITRFHIDQPTQPPQPFTIPRAKIETALTNHTTLNLDAHRSTQLP